MSRARIEGRLSKLTLADKPQIDPKKHKRRVITGVKVTKSKSSSSSAGSKVTTTKYSAPGPSHGDKAEEPKIATAPGQGAEAEELIIDRDMLAFFEEIGGKTGEIKLAVLPGHWQHSGRPFQCT